MKLKIGEHAEIDPCEEISRLIFLGDDSSPQITNNYQDNAGQDGSIHTYSTFGKNTVSAKFNLKFSDYYDFKLAKHDIMRLFSNKQLMRIRTDAEPAIVKFVRAGNFDIVPNESRGHDATFTIPFENPSGYKYSYLTSDNPYLYETEGWQIGMNLPNGQDLHYQFTTPRMRVYNASDIAVDPYYQRHQLKIIIKFNGSFLQLVNQTNGSSWKYLNSSNGQQTIVLDGINTSLDGAPASANTDFGNLVLEPGWNDIVATGATTLDVTFSFPFIYLG
ncbi:MAG TPA: phage tail family protein [Candidatus Ligilactobacillus excrementipullorum]|nr:phage tail family protein [Candidatus Ligilactobacillus excrementipullorum]